MPAHTDYVDGTVIIYDFFTALLSGMQYADSDPVIRSDPEELQTRNGVSVAIVSVVHDEENAALQRDARIMEMNITITSKMSSADLAFRESAGMSMQTEQLMAGPNPENAFGVHLVGGASVVTEWESATFEASNDSDMYEVKCTIEYSILYVIEPGKPGNLI